AHDGRGGAGPGSSAQARQPDRRNRGPPVCVHVGHSRVDRSSWPWSSPPQRQQKNPSLKRDGSFTRGTTLLSRTTAAPPPHDLDVSEASPAHSTEYVFIPRPG